VLHRLAVFAGGFTLEAATAVARSPELGAPSVLAAIANLAAKSLLVVEVSGADTRYRLLETTRAYTLEKLADSGELDGVSRRHAEFFRRFFEQSEIEQDTRPVADWLTVYGRQIDNLRAALDWSFSSSGDAAIGVALTAAAVPLWSQRAFLIEGRTRAERALASFADKPGRDDRREMQIRAALGLATMQTGGTAPDIDAAWTAALHIAEKLGDVEYQLRALWGLWLFRVTRGECRTALELAQRFSERVVDPADRLIGQRLVGTSLHYLGDQTGARRHLEAMLSGYVAPTRRFHEIRFQYDQPLVARMMLARILWLHGLPDSALRLAQQNVDDAKAIGHALSVCGALEVACIVGIWSGDQPATERSVADLLDHSARHGLTAWHARGRCLRGVLLTRRGDVEEGLASLSTALHELRETGFVPYQIALLGTLAQGLAAVGRIAEALATIDEALARSEAFEERWCVAELVRIRAELFLTAGSAEASETEFQIALDWARRQEILSMELRCATGLARLWRDLGRAPAARALVAPIYARFTEGFGTADLRAAKVLLDVLE
jgi:predicted ATPase